MRLYFIIFSASFLFLLINTGCETNLNFERDSIYDEGSTSQNASFIFPNNFENIAPGLDTLLMVKLNSYLANSSQHTLSIISDVDGPIFSSTSFSRDTLSISFPSISAGTHNIKLFIDSITFDSLSVNIVKPNPVQFIQTSVDSGYTVLTWSKYNTPQFEFKNYQVMIKSDNQYIDDTIVGTIEDISDTVFTDHTIRVFEKNVNYYVRTTNKEGHSSNSKLTKLEFKTLGEIDHPLIHPTDPVLFYHNKNSGNKIFRYNFETGELIHQTIESSEIVSLIHIDSSERIIAGLYNKTLVFFDSQTLSLSGSKQVEITPLEILFDNLSQRFFVSMDNSTYSYNSNFSYVDNISNNGLASSIYPEKKMIFNLGRDNLEYSNYNSSGKLAIPSTSSVRVLAGGNITISKTHDVLVKKNYVIKADPSLELLYELPNFESYHTYDHFDLYDPDILWIGLGTGELVKYNIRTEVIVDRIFYKYRINKILQNNSSLFVLLSGNYDNYLLQVY